MSADKHDNRDKIKNRLNPDILTMDVEEQIRRIFDNEISYNIVYDSGISDDICFIIEDDTFLVGDLRSTVSWSLVGQHVILYVEILNEKNRIDFNLILCPNPRT